MRTYTLLLLAILCCFSCEISKAAVSRIYTTALYPPLAELPVKDIVFNDQSYTDYRPEFSFLNEVRLFTFSYEVDGHVVLGYGATPRNQNQWPTVIYRRGGTYET